jgi:hypothetical protein
MDYSDRTSSVRDNPTESATRAWENTREKAEEIVDSGETCVRENPGSAMLTAFLGGMLVGGFIGWRVAENRAHHTQHLIRDAMRDLQRRLHF